MIYNYQCSNCNHEFELKLPMSDRLTPTESPCPNCNELSVSQKVVNPMHFRFNEFKQDTGFSKKLHEIHKRTPGSQLDQTNNFHREW